MILLNYREIWDTLVTEGQRVDLEEKASQDPRDTLVSLATLEKR